MNCLQVLTACDLDQSLGAFYVHCLGMFLSAASV